MAITAYVRAESATPQLALTLTHGAPTQISIRLTAADGTVYTVKSQGSTTIPTSFSLTGLTSQWLTGRYQLRVTDHTEGTTGSLASWAIQL
jgi:subtilisin-like proprotein convertase family protein